VGGGVRRALEPFAMFPHRFIDAEMRGELSDRQAKLCRFVVRHASQDRARLTLAQIATGMRWQQSNDTLLRELKSLRPLWLDFDSSPGQRGPYTFLLTGLAVIRETEGEPQPPHDLRKNRSISAEVELPHAEVLRAASNDSQSRESPPQEPPQTAEALSSLTSSEGSEVKAASEEKVDQALGKTTATDQGVTDRLVAKIERPEHQRNEAPPVHVEQADDRSLVWSGEAQEGEAGVLADCQALVDAGLGEWIEDDRDRLLSDEELAELGTLPLDELHRRRERGEL
jgi:hypothetical protein